MELLNESFDSGDTWFDPHPGEDLAGDFESPCDQGRPKIPKDDQIKPSVKETSPERQRTEQPPCNTLNDPRPEH